MTDKRDLKALVRERMAKTGESYVTAKRAMKANAERCDTKYGECVLPKGHHSEEHGDDHKAANGSYWNVGTTITDPPKLSATDLMRKAFAAWGITVGEGGKLTAPDGRELKAKWSPENTENIVQDLKAFHGIDGEVELARAMMDAVFASLFGKDAEQPKSPELLWQGIGSNNAVFLTDFDRKLMADSLEYRLTPEEKQRILTGPTPADLKRKQELSDEERAKLEEAAAKEPDCTCGEEWGANLDCKFHHPPIVEAPAKAPESIDVAQKLVARAIADHATGVRGVMTIDTGDMTPEQALRVVTATKTQYRAALGKPPLDDKGLCLLCAKAPSHCECEGSKPPWGKAGLCVMCGRNVTCACPVDPAGTTYARCTNADCGKVYRVRLTQSRRCEHCSASPVEVLDPDARTFTTKDGFLTAKEPTAAELFSDDPNHEEDTACSCGDGDDPDCLFCHPLTSKDSVFRVDPETEAVREAQTSQIAAMPAVPVADLVPMLEALKYINGGDAHPDEARAEAREVLEDFDKKHPGVLTALVDPREDEDADPEAVVVVVNGQPFNVAEKVLDYPAVLALAKYDPERVLSVTYRAKSGNWKREGILSPGQSVEVLPGMVFNVADTSRA
jgi:hypothetical protein